MEALTSVNPDIQASSSEMKMIPQFRFALCAIVAVPTSASQFAIGIPLQLAMQSDGKVVLGGKAPFEAGQAPDIVTCNPGRRLQLVSWQSGLITTTPENKLVLPGKEESDGSW